jgi:cytochrome c553
VKPELGNRSGKVETRAASPRKPDDAALPGGARRLAFRICPLRFAISNLELQLSGFFFLALIPGLLSACRLDMHTQPKYKPLEPSAFFDDGRSERPAVPGTVAVGHLRTDEHLYTGRVHGVLADSFPFPITRRDLEWGRERYEIYCSPCHDSTGSGRGMIVERGFPPPPSYHLERLRRAPVGHFFEVMTKGYGTMYSYADRVSAEDRWRIAAYIRALQLSQGATIEDAPPDVRKRLLQPGTPPTDPPPGSRMIRSGVTTGKGQ